MKDNAFANYGFEIFKIVLQVFLTAIVSFVFFLLGKNDIAKQTVETLSSYFEEVDVNMSYEDAMQFLYESSQRKDALILELQNENVELKEIKEQVISEESNQEIITSASSFADEEDYAMAYAILSSIMKKTPQMQVMVDEYQRKYEAQVIMEADSLIYEGNYDKATDVVNKALEVIPDSTILKEKKNSIKDSRPQKLVNVLSPYEANNFSKKTGADSIQMAGESYYDGYEMGHPWNSTYGVFNLNGKYTEITFVIGHVDGTGGGNHVLRITAENEYEIDTIEIPYDGLPKSISIPVSGVNILRFERTVGGGQTFLSYIMIR